MDKNTKIIAILMAAIVAVFALVVFATTAMMNRDKEDAVTATSPDSSESQTVQSSDIASTEPTLTVSTTALTTNTPDLSELIIGKWTDSANMSGYEFYKDGTVEMTYVNLTVPVINIPINGVSKGTYTLDGDRLTTKFSIYSATIENVYTVSVEGNSISMKDHEDGEKATYTKTASTPTTTAAVGESFSDGIIGAWINDNGSVRYSFSDDGTAQVTFSDANVTSISTSPINGVCSGVYLTDGDAVIIQFTLNGAKITQRFTFSVAKNTLSLTDDTGSTVLYAKENSSVVGQGSDALLGKWTDSAGMSGYEFKEGGVIDITYVNLTVPVVNIPINGTFSGSYTVEGNSVTVSYSIYGSSMVDTYEYSVNGNSLTLKSADGNISTYIKK